MVNESSQVIMTLTQQDASNLIAGFIGLLLALFLMGNFILNIFFVLSVRKTMKMIPAEHHKFSPNLLWWIIVPFVGYVFEWIMLPFGVPRTIESFFLRGNEQDRKVHNRFFGLGLAAVIVELGSFSLVGFVSWILKIIYWVQAVSLRYQIEDRLNVQDKTSDQALL